MMIDKESEGELELEVLYVSEGIPKVCCREVG